jgi:hypothetical protein
MQHLTSSQNAIAHPLHMIRRDRIFKQAKGWFFATREGIDMGPFPDQTSAELEMVNYVRSMYFSNKHRQIMKNR